MNDSGDSALLMRRVPRIRRARGFRLYTESGKRIVDLWQCGGSAVLGHTPPRVLLALKDTASRGLLGPFPSAHGKRLEKALSRLVEGRSAVRLYSGIAEADRALAAAGFSSTPLTSFADPAIEDISPVTQAALWRPWIDPGLIPPVLSPILPLPLEGCPVALLLSSDLSDRFPEPAPASPLLLAALCRSVADLSAALGRAERRLGDKLISAVQSLPGAILRGPYLRFAEASDPAAYESLFERFLRHGLLLPPNPKLPAILPLEMSGGEEASIVAALKNL